MTHTDLTVDIFLVLRDNFFDHDMTPIPFSLRPKRQTQDDPLDEHISVILADALEDALCEKATGSLTNPDLVVYRPQLCNGQPGHLLREDTTRIVAVEVKKLNRTATGKIPRPTGLDYNTTPPCGTIRVYDTHDTPIDIKGFYLFVAQEEINEGHYIISALVLCDGNILNADFDYYLSIVGEREKEINLGTYGDGMDRKRPMLVFSNPLGASQLDNAATLISESNALDQVSLAYILRRHTQKGEIRDFYAYRKPVDLPANGDVLVLDNPFPQPRNRGTTTQSRGHFRVHVEVG